MKKLMRIYGFIFVVSALLLASCGSPTAQAALPPTPIPAPSLTAIQTDQPQQSTSTPVPGLLELQLSLVRTIDGGANTFGHPNGLAFDSRGSVPSVVKILSA